MLRQPSSDALNWAATMAGLQLTVSWVADNLATKDIKIAAFLTSQKDMGEKVWVIQEHS